jgi:membrane-associated protein
VGPPGHDGPVNFLSGLHGAVALALLPALLFAEEAGVPLPFAPGELTLLVAGLLIASGGLNPYAFIPLALIACIAGSLVGYSWARAVGDRGLKGLARRLRQQRNLERVEDRLRKAGWQGIAISRLIPGLRIYTTLVAGAVRAPRRSFVLAMISSTIVWVGVYVALGILIGVPVEHFLDQIQKLAVQGAILIAMGVGCYLAVRKTPSSSGAGLVRVPRWVRVLLAALIDIGVVASIVTGLLALGRLLGVGFGSGWIDGVVVLLVVGAFYVIVARRSAGATAGEVLLQTSYVSGHGLPLKPRAALDAVRSLVSRSDDELTATGDLLHALGDPARLRIVTQLLDRPQKLEDLATKAKLSPFEVRHQLERFQSTGVLVITGQDPNQTYAIRSDLRPVLLQLLAIMESTQTTAPAEPAPEAAPKAARA